VEIIARGDVLIAAQRGAITGKPRPVVVIQNNTASASHPAITACLMTTELKGTGLIRLAIMPSASNGLLEPSEVQIDQIHTFRRSTIDRRIGRLSADDMERIDGALRRWLEL
jgi:mRNA interferase MazF